MLVRIYSVSTDDCDVSSEDREFDSWEDVLQDVREEYGDEDISDTPIEELDSGNEIIFEGDVYFVKYEVIRES